MSVLAIVCSFWFGEVGKFQEVSFNLHEPSRTIIFPDGRKSSAIISKSGQYIFKWAEDAHISMSLQLDTSLITKGPEIYHGYCGWKK